MQTRRRLAVAAAFVCCAATPAAAQQMGSIVGQVLGPEEDPLESARVVVLGGHTGAVTNSAGAFRITGVAPGWRQIVIEYLGLRPDTVTVQVQAGGVSPVQRMLTPLPVALSGIEVEGERGAQLRSINEQRQAHTVVNIVSGDEIGQLPDQNVAEAAQRVAGVSVQTSRGEGRFVSIRGTAPNLNNVVLNGQTLASTASSRATALDLLPSSMVSAIEITKAITPNMDGNAVGGTINIRTISAFDRTGSFMSGSLRNHVHQRQVDYGDGKLPYEAELTAGTRFGRQGQFGVVVSGSASRRDFAASVLDPDGWEDVDGAILPNELELQVEDNERERYGLSTNLDWRPRASTSLYLRGLLTRTREVTANSEYEFGFEGDLAMDGPTTGRFTGGSAELDLSEDDERETLWALTLGGEQRLSRAITWDAAGTFTQGRLDSRGPDVTFETTDEDALSSHFDVSPYFFVIEPDDPQYVSDPTNYPLRSASFDIGRNRENTWVGATNLRLDGAIGGLNGFVMTGGKVQRRDKVVDQQSLEYIPSGIDLEPYALPATGTVQGGSEAFVHGDVKRWGRFFAQNRENAEYFTLDAVETELNSIDSDSDNEETVLAGYVMVGTDLGPLSLQGGARVERTATRTLRYEVGEDDESGEVTAPARRAFDSSYTNWLPAVVAKYTATDRLTVRVAWTNTIGRPDYDELAAFREVSWRATSVPGVFEGSIAEGNPNLQPYEAANLDGSVEYYFPLGGMAAVGAFHKRIDNPIYEFEETRRDVTFEGRVYDELVITQDRNADAGTLTGVELTYSQPLFFLPAPFDGLGITANAAFIDSEVTVPGREDERLTFFGQSDRVFNVIPYYQRGPLEMRLAYTYRGPFLADVGGEQFEDRYGDARATYDMTGRYSLFADRLELFAQVRNLTNEPEVGYQGSANRYDVHTLTGRTFTFGISATR